MMNNTRKTGKWFFLCFLLYFGVASIPVLIFTEDKLKGELGLVLGIIIGAIMFFSIVKTMNRALRMSSGMGFFMTLMMLGRFLLVGTFLLVIGTTKAVNLFTAIVGLLIYQPAIYIYPFVGKDT